MRYYQLKSHPAAGTIKMSPRWRLPSIQCSTCEDTWGTLGVRAIGVSFAGLPEEPKYRWENAVAVPPAELPAWTEPLRGLAPESVLRPSGSFGPRTGRIVGQYSEFAWLGATAIALRGDEATSLRAHGVDLVTYELDPTRDDGYCEPELLPMARLLPDLIPPPVCGGCGRRDYRQVADPVFDRASFGEQHLVRGYEFTAQIFVSQHFKDVVEGRHWTGLAFADVELS